MEEVRGSSLSWSKLAGELEINGTFCNGGFQPR